MRFYAAFYDGRSTAEAIAAYFDRPYDEIADALRRLTKHGYLEDLGNDLYRIASALKSETVTRKAAPKRAAQSKAADSRSAAGIVRDCT
jgi:hypothetical protein